MFVIIPIELRSFTRSMLKLIIAQAVVAMTSSVQYPAGLHPAVCPNYPFCDVNVMAQYTPSGIPFPSWAFNPNQQPLARADHARTKTLKNSAEVNNVLCPNYPYCDANGLTRYTPSGSPIPFQVLNPASVPTQVYDLPKYVDRHYPTDCPNHLFCDNNDLTRYNPSGIFTSKWDSNPALSADNSADSAIITVALGYPADMDPAQCPNYPFCW